MNQYSYMVIVKIKPEYYQAVYDFYINRHLNKVIASGCFTTWCLEYEDSTQQFIVKYLCPSQKHMDNYLNQYANKLRLETLNTVGYAILEINRYFSKQLTTSEEQA